MKICGIIFGIILLILGFMSFSLNTYQWILIIAGIVLILHALMCKRCCGACEMPEKVKPKRKR